MDQQIRAARAWAASVDVETANRAGLLHPSQRRWVLGPQFTLRMWSLGLLSAVLILQVVALFFVTSPLDHLWSMTYFVIVLLPSIQTLQALSEYRRGRVTVVTGPAYDFGSRPMTDDHPIALQSSRLRLRAGGRTYRVGSRLWPLLRPDAVNTVCLLPRSNRVVNVLPG